MWIYEEGYSPLAYSYDLQCSNPTDSHFHSRKNKQIKKLQLSSTKSSESIWEMLLTAISKLPFCFKLQLDGRGQRIHFDYQSHYLSLSSRYMLAQS